jgi:integrase
VGLPPAAAQDDAPQLRHNAGTRVREDYDAETAQVVLGHKNLKVTEIYAEKNLAKARRVMSEVG